MGVAFCPSVEDALNDEDCWWWRWGSLPPLEEFAAHVVNQVHQEQIVAGERRPRTLWKSQLCRSRVTVQKFQRFRLWSGSRNKLWRPCTPLSAVCHESGRHGRFFPYDCRQAQDARHHGRHQPEDQLISASSSRRNPRHFKKWYSNVMLA